MGILNFLSRSQNNVAETQTAGAVVDKELSDLISTMRSVSRKSISDAAPSLDTAILAGGVLGSKVTLVQKKTSDLNDQIGGASTSIEQIALNVRLFNGIIDKQDDAVSQTGVAMEEMSASVNSVTEITRKKMEAAGKLKEIIGQGGERVITTAKAIEEVTEAINGVAEIIKVINSIAAQTNLLAMNAAIEAAHAGEFGKGFAVVAAEVRKLAESTTANSKAIADSLKSIINQIKGAKEASESAGTTFEDIQEEVETFVNAFAEISHSTTELSVGTKQIFNSMEGLKQVSSEISNRSKDITAGADELNNTLKGIKTSSKDLLKDMGVMEEKIFDVSSARSGIYMYTVDINRTVEDFFREMIKKGILAKETQAFNYDYLVLLHRNWLIQLRAFLDNKRDRLTSAPDDHQKCELGVWIYGDGKVLSENRSYRELEAKHKSFHALAGNIIKLKQSGSKEIAEQKYMEILEEYNGIVKLLENLRRERP